MPSLNTFAHFFPAHLRSAPAVISTPRKNACFRVSLIASRSINIRLFGHFRCCDFSHPCDAIFRQTSDGKRIYAAGFSSSRASFGFLFSFSGKNRFETRDKTSKRGKRLSATFERVPNLQACCDLRLTALREKF